MVLSNGWVHLDRTLPMTKDKDVIMQAPKTLADVPISQLYPFPNRLTSFIHIRRLLPPTPRQIQLLKQHHRWREGMSRGEAYDAIKRLF